MIDALNATIISRRIKLKALDSGAFSCKVEKTLKNNNRYGLTFHHVSFQISFKIFQPFNNTLYICPIKQSKTTKMATTSSTAQQVCNTIMQQLGGNKFLAMTGSKPLHYGTNDSGNDFITLKLTRNEVGAKWLRISLLPSDTYKMEFIKEKKTLDKSYLPMKIYDKAPVTVVEKEGVYCDMLQSIFTSVTGLYTSLGSC